jgi:hypothetical protein
VHETIEINCYDCENAFSCNDPFDKTYYNNKTKVSPDGWCWVRHMIVIENSIYFILFCL